MSAFLPARLLRIRPNPYASLRVLLFVSLLALWLALPPAAHAQARNLPVDRIVAVVNNEVITERELTIGVEHARHQLTRQNIALPPELELERQVLERLVVERVQLQLAQETGLRIDELALERAVERIASNNRLDAEGLRAALAEDGISWAAFRENLRNEMLLSRLREREVDSKVTITDAEIDHFLIANPETLGAEEWLVGHILLRVPEGASPDQLATLRERAEQARTRVADGETFAAVAASVSDAPDALQGGNLGWRSPDRLPAIFVDALRELEPGQLSPLLRSPAGFHLVLFADRRGGTLAAPQQVQQTRARHILIRSSEVVSDEEAERRLWTLRERVINGADFAELARAHSDDLSSAQGGDLGWVYPGDTVPEFERAMNPLGPNQVSEPVRSPFGWHLIQVLERRIQDVSDERRRNVIRQALAERKADEAFEEWVRQLRDSSFVEFRLEE